MDIAHGMEQTPLKRLIIVGAGGGAREVYAWARRQYGSDEFAAWEPVGFLDNNARALDGKKSPLSIIGSVDSWEPQMDEVFVCGIGNPKYRLPVCDMLATKGMRFVTVCDPSAVLDPTADIACGCVIYPGVMVGPDTVIGAHVYLNMNAVVGHDAVIEAGTIVSPNASVLGGAKVGRGAFLGTGAIILPGITIGDGAIVGAGAMVNRDVAPGITVVGNPARQLGKN